MKAPAYSLIIPVYNRPQELDELLACIQSQEFKDFEVVVIEDGSTEDASAVIEKYKEAFSLAYYLREIMHLSVPKEITSSFSIQTHF
jgi:glycosyltransferase involved in cell wall biosynthesis